MEQLDVAIVGGGPAGLQAALVLARTRKRVVVFDDPTPPRNAASRGVHNFLGLDGLTPDEIRDRGWTEIGRYGTARLERRTVTSIDRDAPDGEFVIDTEAGRWSARHVLLACGYRDVYPDIDGFAQCWAHTIIPCPFCDGYENRDRTWGIVPSMVEELEVFPSMVRNWTVDRLVIAPRDVEVTAAREAELRASGVPVHRGDIVGLTHERGELSALTLDNGHTVAVGTLLWTPAERPTTLVTDLVERLGLALDAHGHVAVDEFQRTNIDRLWAAGDVQGWTGAIEAATHGSMAAAMIVHGWYASNTAVAA